MSTFTQLLDIERSELGYKEDPPDSNQTKYGEWYRFNRQPWCAMFQSWAVAEAGGKFRFAAVAAAVAWAKKAGTWRQHPAPGLMACKLYTKTKGHIGIVESVLPAGLLDTIEGNTSVLDDRNGGTVARRRRAASFWNAGYIEVPDIDYSTGQFQVPRREAPTEHAPDGNPFTLLVVDGDLGPQTNRALQWSLNNTGANPRLETDGKLGSQSRRALQGRLNHVVGGVAADGRIGPVSVKALQKHVGAEEHGRWDSATTLALQRALNEGRF